MSLKTKKIRGSYLRYFRHLLKNPEITMQYIKSSDCYGLFYKGKITGGFCISNRPIDDMLSIAKIPKENRNNYGNEDPFKYAELAGCFLLHKKFKLQYQLRFILKLLFHRASYFVYTYTTDNNKLETITKHGCPLRLYSGNNVNVEIMSKFGLLKILSRVLKKYLYKKIYRS